VVLIQTECIAHLIALQFGSQEIIINAENDEITINGNTLNQSKNYYSYNKHFLKQKNKGKEKICLKELIHYPFILKIEKGFDGRIFFIAFNEDNIKKYRSKPLWQASYFNRNENQKEWYENNLKTPKKTIKFNTKKYIPTIKDYTY
jgi:hypothetical protein